VLTVKQKLELIEKCGNGESVTELAKYYGVGIEWLYPRNNATGLIVSELLLMKTTT
jgi:Zn-dependent peptidase ImmA (M78 family)